MIESIHCACSPPPDSIRSSSALPRITDSGPRISWTMPGQQPADLRELLVEHRQAGHLAELDQPADPPEDDLARRVLQHVVVGPGLQPGDDVGIVVPDGQHQDRDIGDLPVGPDRPADVQPAHVRQVDVEDDDMRPDPAGLLERLYALGDLVDRISGAAEDGPQQGPIGCIIIDDQDATAHRPRPSQGLGARAEGSESTGQYGSLPIRPPVRGHSWPMIARRPP